MERNKKALPRQKGNALIWQLNFIPSPFQLGNNAVSSNVVGTTVSTGYPPYPLSAGLGGKAPENSELYLNRYFIRLSIF
jgi:hypothetical protein